MLTLLSFCTEGLPEVAESTVFSSEGKPSSWGEGTRQYDLAVGKFKFGWRLPTV